ncbi:unnamed protein product [Acanthoscelides obtectus]|uniref:Uncharacterized protein n=1 Tax=Acanthoscelides obtectus TaxID=200917 RepID=A0A9P0VQZ9_ACAOB|nr:unnamed protein product [Acanthoscelides obtectus]CAK1687234.1 hypothetical protein AOBTE_LOCUS36220 [Acanthoscelides obtectus]
MALSSMRLLYRPCSGLAFHWRTRSCIGLSLPQGRKIFLKGLVVSTFYPSVLLLDAFCWMCFWRKYWRRLSTWRRCSVGMQGIPLPPSLRGRWNRSMELCGWCPRYYGILFWFPH